MPGCQKQALAQAAQKQALAQALAAGASAGVPVPAIALSARKSVV
jgi:hypothetical protein